MLSGNWDGYILVAFQVVPTELEALLLSHQDVTDAGVVGIPDADANELPAAFVVRRAGSSVTENQLQTFVSGNHHSSLNHSINQSVINQHRCLLCPNNNNNDDNIRIMFMVLRS